MAGRSVVNFYLKNSLIDEQTYSICSSVSSGYMGSERRRSAVCSATTLHRFDPALEAAIERGLVVVEEGARGGERIAPA